MKAQLLIEEAKRLMDMSDSFSEKGDKEQSRLYLIKACQKNKEAFDISSEDAKKLISEMINYKD